MINIAEKAAGFTIGGDTGTEAGVSVVVKVGSHTFDAVTSADPDDTDSDATATWSVSVPTAATLHHGHERGGGGHCEQDRLYGT